MSAEPVNVCDCGSVHLGPCPATERQHLAEHIDVIRDADGLRIVVDGVLFPFYTAQGGWQISVDRQGVPGVTITLVARTLDVHDSLLRKATP